MSQPAHPFDALTPDFVIDAIESRGLHCDGRVFALNSYENRVYQIGIDEEAPVIAKFYRPGRWSDEQILEEHSFCFELADQELPVVAPLSDNQGDSLLHFGDFRFAVYPRKGGHAPELDDPDNLLILGRMLGRIHLVGAGRAFEHRPALDTRTFGYESAAYISDHFIPVELKNSYDTLVADLLPRVDTLFEEVGTEGNIRTHGDCHIGNILWRNDAPHFVDFDDSRMAPAIQDLWMLLSGDRRSRSEQLSEIVEGYNEFYDFQPRELQLVEALRTLRMINYAAWLARRWDDPAFPMNFPWFNTVRYWGDHILELREQLSALDEPILNI